MSAAKPPKHGDGPTLAEAMEALEGCVQQMTADRLAAIEVFGDQYVYATSAERRGAEILEAYRRRKDG